MVEYKDYVHEPTQKLRQSLIYSARTKVRGIGGRQLIFVPNFRTFTGSFSNNRAELLIVSSFDQEINVSEAVLHNIDTSSYEKIALDNKNIKFKSIEGTGYYIASLPLIGKDDAYIDKFNTAKKLELTITYRNSSNEVKKEIMAIELVTKSDIAWPT